jgi:hypothetical protein
MVVIYSDSYGELHIHNKLWKLRLEELKKVKCFVGYDKGERLKMSRKVLKNGGIKKLGLPLQK